MTTTTTKDSTKNLLTVHVLTPVRWGNLNRDDQGVPKTTVSGGIQRGLLSPQSIKRAARTRFESLALPGTTGSIRSTNIAKAIAGPIIATEADLEPQKVATEAIRLVSLLTAGKERLPKGKVLNKLVNEIVHDAPLETVDDAAEQDTTESDGSARPTAVWMSEDEIAAARSLIIQAVRDGVTLKGLDAGEDAPVSNRTHSLSIAALGRMNAQAPGTNIDAAVAVGPAITVHPVVIETDFFTTVDDLATGTGAAHMGTKFHTAGTFYRTFTIDRRELATNWKAIEVAGAQDAVAALLESLITALPTGMANNSDPYTLPFVVLAEEQAHRVSYDFETPVRPDRRGGYEQNAVAALSDRYAAARRFRPRQFGRTMVVGTSEIGQGGGEGALFAGAERPEGGFDALVEWVAQWAVSP